MGRYFPFIRLTDSVEPPVKERLKINARILKLVAGRL